MILNEYQRQNTKIRSLNEFLLYLPLCEPYSLADVLFRINGNLKNNQEYIEDQFNYLYKRIPDSPAKTYADQCRYFYLNPPSVYEIHEETKDLYKVRKYDEYVVWQRDKVTRDAALDYEKRYSRFLKRMTMVESIKSMLEGLGSDDDI